MSVYKLVVGLPIVVVHVAVCSLDSRILASFAIIVHVVCVHDKTCSQIVQDQIH